MGHMKRFTIAATTLCLLLVVMPVVGGIGGWLFAWVFEDSFNALLRLLRIQVTGFELGAALAFLGAFFSSK